MNYYENVTPIFCLMVLGPLNLVPTLELASGVPRGGQRGARAPGATLGGAEIDRVLKKSDQPIGISWPERN